MSYIKGVSEEERAIELEAEFQAKTAKIERNRQRLFIIEKSRDFGRTIRELEDFGCFEERLRVRKEWKDFSNRTIDKQYRLMAVDAYYDEYCREPTDEEYKEVECRILKKYGSSS